MNIRDLEYLVAVHDVNNFSKAAEMCNVSQPTLSGQLKKLENDLDAPLMERSTRHVLFTPIGKSVVEHARNVLTMVEKIQDLAKVDEGVMSGDFHVGMIPSVGPFLLPKLMPQITKQYPKMNLYLYELQKDKLLSKLSKGELDAVIITKKTLNQPLEETHLYTENLLLAVSDKDELVLKNEPVTKKTMKGRSLLMLEDGYCLREQALDVCSSIGAKEDHRYKATSIDSLLHMVKSNNGITLMPELACDEATEGLKFLPFKTIKPKRDVVMLTRKGSFRNDALSVIAKTIIDTAKQRI